MVDEVVSRVRRIAKLDFDYSGQQKEPVETCNLCGGRTWVVITHSDRYGYPATSTACALCSLTILNPRMSAAAYADFYRSVYRPLVSAYHGRLIDAQTVKEEQASYASHILGLIRQIRHEQPPQTMLDIGGSTGVIASRLAAELDLKATIIDPAPDEIAEAQGLGIETITGFIEDWRSNGRTFDVVGMFQTIDHLLDVSLTLQIVHEVLADGGLFVVDIVDFRASYLRNRSMEDATKIDHPYSLTQPTMEAYLRRSGFEVNLKSYSPDHLHVMYLCSKATPDPDALPPASMVEHFFDEVRYVQNAVKGDR